MARKPNYKHSYRTKNILKLCVTLLEPAFEKNITHEKDRWTSFGVKIEQDLHEAVFGLTFVALDPDGHRIRVCMPDK